MTNRLQQNIGAASISTTELGLGLGSVTVKYKGSNSVDQQPISHVTG